VRAGWFLGCALFVLLFAGCGAFDTRNPIIGTGQISRWEPPTSPEIIVRNLEVALEDGNFNDYQRALTSDFVFHPDAADSFEIELNRPGAFANWNRDVEVQTAQTIETSADSLRLTVSPPTQEIVGDDRLLKQTYILTLEKVTGEESFEGEAWLWTRQVAGEWFIYRWRDIRTSEDLRSWGFLKGDRRLL
jgi:hypothetical protein